MNLRTAGWITALLLTACGGGGGEPASGGSASPTGIGSTPAAGGPSLPTTVSPGTAGALRWSDPATWGGALPGEGARIVIPAGRTVLLDVATPALKGLVVNGTLAADPERDVAITTDHLMVRGGALRIGTAAAPYRRQARITLTGGTTADQADTAGFGAKVLGLIGGSIELHGAPEPRSWVKLGADAAAGARTITLAEPSAWQPGDQIVIATSTPEQDHHDVATVQSVSGTTVTLTAPLRHAHFGSVRRLGNVDIDVRAEVGRLNRNIVVEGDAASASSRVGGHAMFMADGATARVQIAQVEFRAMGQLDQLGRYPVHFHLMADRCGDCYVKDSAVRDTVQRGIVVHGTSGVAVSGNVIFNTVGHNLVLEDENTRGNVVDRNLALVNRQPVPAHTQPVLVLQEDRLPSNFWFKAGDNAVTNNHAAGSFWSGFTYVGIDPTEDEQAVGTPIDFRGNTAHASMVREGANPGDFDIGGGLLIATETRRPATDRIQDTLVYQSAIGLWPEESGVFLIDRFVLAENALDIENRGVGNRTHYRNGLFVGRLPGSPTPPNTNSVHHQYGSIARLENVTFADYGMLGLSASDTMPTQAYYHLAGVQFLGTRPHIGLNDQASFEFGDDSVLPRGFYVSGDAPWLATPACARVALPVPGDDPEAWFRCPSRVRYAELEVRDRPDSGFDDKVNPFLRRSDGLRYRLGEAGGENIGSGGHATTVVYNADLAYALDAAPSAGGWAVRLMDAGTAGDDFAADAAWLTLSLPVAAPPSGVHRTGLAFDRPDAPTAANALRAATSRADFDAHPRTSWWYDATSRTVTVQAGARWLVVRP